MNSAYYRQLSAPNPLTAARHLIEEQARTIASLAGENARLKAATVTKPSNRTVLPPVTEVDRNEVLECFVTGAKLYRPEAYAAGWVVNGMLDNYNPRYLSPAGVRISEGMRKESTNPGGMPKLCVQDMMDEQRAIVRSIGEKPKFVEEFSTEELKKSTLREFIADFEKSHARSLSDTLANDTATFVWNMVRHRAGLPMLVKADFPQYSRGTNGPKVREGSPLAHVLQK